MFEKRPLYIPVLKASESELRAIRNLDDGVKSMIMPVIDLTRGRRTKSDPDGATTKRASQIREAVGSFPFLVDLTTQEDLLNSEMETFFVEENGYNSWVQFFRNNFPSNAIPIAQYAEGGSEVEFKKQVENLAVQCGKVGLRSSVRDIEVVQLYRWMTEVLGAANIISVSNLFFLDELLVDANAELAKRFVTNVFGNQQPYIFGFPSSGFPRSVASGDYGEDSNGEFPAAETTLHRRLLQEFRSNRSFVRSDYGSVHPIRYPTKGGSWVPRVDATVDGAAYFYNRFRNADGGYVGAARAVWDSRGRELSDCWGKQQIRDAAGGSPAGRNPSFWISVRINLWITTVVGTLTI